MVGQPQASRLTGRALGIAAPRSGERDKMKSGLRGPFCAPERDYTVLYSIIHSQLDSFFLPKAQYVEEDIARVKIMKPEIK